MASHIGGGYDKVDGFGVGIGDRHLDVIRTGGGQQGDVFIRRVGDDQVSLTADYGNGRIGGGGERIGCDDAHPYRGAPHDHFPGQSA